MGVWLRRLRAALGNAVTWAVGWGAVGIGLGIFLGVGMPSVPFWVIMIRLGVTTGLAGFIAGGSFAVVLGLMERNRTLADLRVSRIALWGAVGGMAFPAVSLLAGLVSAGSVPMVIVFGVTGLLGAGSSAGSLILARRAERLELEPGVLDELEAGSSP